MNSVTGWIFIAGIVAALVMAGFLIGIDRSGLVQSRDFWLFGRLFFRDPKKSRLFALASHTVAGICFAFFYIALWSFLRLDSFIEYVLAGLITGLVHGVMVSIAQINLVANLRKGFQITLTYATSHIVYGVVLGFMAALANSQIDLDLRYAQTLTALIHRQHYAH